MNQDKAASSADRGWADHRHRDVSGGWLRPTVFGAVDGLVTNASLIAGVGGVGVSAHTIVLTGLAGLVAGAFSMGTGEYISVTNQNELVQAEVAVLGGNILVQPFSSLLMHFAEHLDAQVIVRGLRAVADFEYEFQMTAMNQRLNDDIETVFLMADPRHQAIASRLVKEIVMLGGDITGFVSPAIAKRLLERAANA